MANKGLGKGLGALFSDQDLMNAPKTKLKLSEIEANPNQARQDFEKGALDELTESIRQNGVIQPIVVRILPNGKYQIIAGERRYRASKNAGLSEIPVNIIDVDEFKARELSLIENLQREDLNPIEEANGISRLMKEHQLTQEAVADLLSKSRSQVANTIRLLNLEPTVISAIEAGKISVGHGKVILSIEEPEKQKEVLDTIVKKELTVRETEKFIQNASKVKAEEPKNQAVNYLEDLERKLSTKLGRRVKMTGGNHGGKVILEYYDLDDLDALIDTLMKRGV